MLLFEDEWRYCAGCHRVNLMGGSVVYEQVAPLLEKLSSLDAPMSAASPVQEANLTQYKHALQQACPPYRAHHH